MAADDAADADADDVGGEAGEDLSLPTDALFSEAERNVADAVRAAVPFLRERSFDVDQEPDLEERRAGALELASVAHQLGCHRACSSTSIGGLGLPARTRAILLEELARGDAGLALTVASSMNQARRLEQCGSAEVRTRFLAPFLADETGAEQIGGASTEPDVGTDAINPHVDGDLRTTVTAVDGGYEVSGEKWMTTNGGCASVYVVSGQFNGAHGYAGRKSVVVAADAKGVACELVGTHGLRSSFHGRMTFDRVRVPASHALDLPRFDDDDTRKRAMAIGLAAHALQLGALSVGVAQAAHDLARARAKERVQGGRPILEHPSIAARFVAVRGRIEQARALIWTAAALEDKGALDAGFGPAVKDAANAAAHAATVFAVEVFGSHGIVDRHPVSKLWRDAQCIAPAVATADMLRTIACS